MHFPSFGGDDVPYAFLTRKPNVQSHSCKAWRNALKVSPVAGMVLLAMSQVAEAKCGTEQLDGNWLLLVPGRAVTHEVTISAGMVFTNGSSQLPDFPIKQFENCRIRAVSLFGSSEAIPTGSQRRPRTITLASDPVYYYVLVRR